MPIVVVGNKTDQARTTAQPELEAVASLDWEHGYVECSARDNYNVDQVTWSPGDDGDGDGDGGGGVQVFKELLHQAKSRFDFRAPVSGSGRGSLPGTPLVMRRRTSLPQVMIMMVMMMMMMMMMVMMIMMTMVLQVPAFSRLMQSSGDTAEAAGAKKVEKRSHSFALSRRRDSCKVQ